MADKILIVDDDIDSLKLIGLMLQRHGYEVVAANAGNQALTKAASEKPSLIILDVMMPDMDGYEVCRRLRLNEETRAIPIIMFTAKTLIDDKVQGFEAGADDYLTKPTHPAELASRVKAILARNAGKQKIAKINQNATIGVLGAKGGVGTTTVAMNLGAAMLQAGDNPIVADFRPGFGSLGLMLGHAQSRGMAKLLDQPNGNIDADTVGAQVITHQSGLRLLLSSARPSEGMNQYAPENAVQIAKTVKTLANPAIYDLGAGLTPFNSRLIKEVDRLIIVVEPSRIALDMTRELFSVIEGEGVARAKMNIVIVSRAQSSLQTSWQEIEQALGQEIKAIISAAPELAFQANEAGVPMVLFRPNAITSSQLTKLAEDFKGRPPRPVG